jgi:shikimate kinase
VGRALADLLGRRFFDLDQEIERRTGRAIREIFAADGEDFFRNLEHTVTQDISSESPMVVAPGGGWICRGDNLRVLRPPSRLVYLRVSPEVALERMGEEAQSRPMLDLPDPAAELLRLYMERDGLYAAADLFVDTEVLAVEEITQLLATYARALQLA